MGYAWGSYAVVVIMLVIETWRAHSAYPHLRLRDAIWEQRQKNARDERHCEQEHLLKAIAREHRRNKSHHVGGPSVP